MCVLTLAAYSKSNPTHSLSSPPRCAPAFHALSSSSFVCASAKYLRRSAADRDEGRSDESDEGAHGALGQIDGKVNAGQGRREAAHLTFRLAGWPTA